jgi:hypothetical protein
MTPVTTLDVTSTAPIRLVCLDLGGVIIRICRDSPAGRESSRHPSCFSTST